MSVLNVILAAASAVAAVASAIAAWRSEGAEDPGGHRSRSGSDAADTMAKIE